MRSKSFAARLIAWVLHLPVGTLFSWDQGFDDQMKPYKILDNRGKSGKLTIEIVRKIVDCAKKIKAEKRRIRIKSFVNIIKEQLRLDLGRKTVTEILIANDLWKAETRRRRPRFYQSLCRRMPNGLLSLDGSELVVFINGIGYRYNVELAVDVGSFCHTGCSIADTETADAVIMAIEQHRRQWGDPVGVIFDSGSANLSDEVKTYLKGYGIEMVPVGPGNPKGNGTDEGAFSQMKKTLGPLKIDACSPRALAKSILEMVVSLYIRMRNQMGLRRNEATPRAQMQAPVTDEQRQIERKRLVAHNQSRGASDPNQGKVERIQFIIDYNGLVPEEAERKRAENCIRFYDPDAISQSEEAFLKAINRDPRRRSLPYFFGILRNIQQKIDDDHYQTYCRNRYNYESTLKEERRLQEQQKPDEPARVEDIIKMAVQAATRSLRSIKELAVRRVKEWTEELVKSVQYVGPLKKQFIDAIGALGHLDENQKENVWKLIEQFLMPKTGAESVTQFS